MTPRLPTPAPPRPRPPAPAVPVQPWTGQLLQLACSGQLYRMSIWHADCHCLRRYERRPAPPEHTHEAYHVLLFTRGANRFRLQGRSLPMSRGLLAITSPTESHEFGPLDPGELAYHEVTFGLSAKTGSLRVPFHRLLGLYTGTELPEVAMPIQLKERQVREMDELYRVLLDQFTRGQLRDSFSAQLCLSQLFGFLLREVYRTPGAAPPASDGLERAKRLIEEEYRGPIALERVAAAVGLSPEYLCRAFKRRYGLPPIAFQLRLRLSAARNLLLASDLSCKEIAARTGFADTYSFSKAFKRAHGLSPVAYARATRQGGS